MKKCKNCGTRVFSSDTKCVNCEDSLVSDLLDVAVDVAVIGLLDNLFDSDSSGSSSDSSSFDGFGGGDFGGGGAGGDW